MESRVTIHKLYSFTLEEREATYLRNLTQNCLLDKPDNESKEDKEIRKAFFEAVSRPEVM